MNPYINEVEVNGSVVMSVRDTTAVASDVAQGKAFYLASGEKATGTSENITTQSLSVTANGTYTAPTGTAYTPVSVNVPSGVPLPTTITAGDTPVRLISLPDAVRTGSSLEKHGQITVTKSGTYRVKYSFHQQDGSTATTAIYKNGTKVSGNYTAQKDTVSVSYDLACQAGDTVEVWGQGGTNILTQRWLAYGHMALCIDWDNTF